MGFVFGGGAGTTVTATGSTTARSLSDRASEIKNVRDWGAVGDGVTNDHDAIQAAIDYVSSPYSSDNRGEIFFPAGLYQIGSSLTFPNPLTAIGFRGVPGAKIRGNFADALLKREVNSPLGGTYYIEGLQLENTHAAGKGILFHSIVGGSISNCAIVAYIGIETYNSQSVSIRDCSIGPGSPAGAGDGIGIMAGNATSVISTDISGYVEAIRHYSVGLTVLGGRFEVNKYAFMLGKDAAGSTSNSTNVKISGVSTERNGENGGATLYLNSVAGAEFSGVAAGGAGSYTLEYGCYIANAQQVVFNGCSFNKSAYGASAWRLGAMQDVQFNSCYGTNWDVPTGADSFEFNLCSTGTNGADPVEITFAKLPAGARPGMIHSLSDAASTATGAACTAGGSNNHIVVCKGASSWIRIA